MNVAQALGNFCLYDYREPQAVPQELKGAFNVVVADPPYLVCMETLHNMTFQMCPLRFIVLLA